MHDRVAVVAAVAVTFGIEKLILALAVLGMMTYLTAIGKVDAAAPVGVATAILGYVFGASSPGAVQAASSVNAGTEPSTEKTPGA